MTEAAPRPPGRPRIPDDVRRRAVELRAAGGSYGDIAEALTDAAAGVYVSKASVIRFCRGSASGEPVQNSPDPGANGGGRP